MARIQQRRGWLIAIDPYMHSDFRFSQHLTRDARFAYFDSLLHAAQSDGPGSLYPHTRLADEFGKDAARVAGSLIARDFWHDYGIGYVAQPYEYMWLRPETRVPIPQWLRTAVLERDGYACRYCGASENLHMDHIHPWSRGGADTYDNLQTLCRPCNVAKGARH